MTTSTIVTCPDCGSKNRIPVAATGRPRCAKCRADLPWLVSADDATLPGALGTSMLIVLDLWAPWCGPCRMVAPVLEQLAQEYAGRIKVVKVNVDEAPGAAANYEARSIPTLLLVDQRSTVDRVVGAQPKPVLAQRIDRALASQAPQNG
jgi:thioredoxin 2